MGSYICTILENKVTYCRYEYIKTLNTESTKNSKEKVGLLRYTVSTVILKTLFQRNEVSTVELGVKMFMNNEQLRIFKDELVVCFKVA
jgi:hypothetical protein